MFRDSIEWKISRIKEICARNLFRDILEAMNPNTNQLRIGPEFRERYDRRAMTRALATLEGIHYIRRARSDGSWDIIWVSPDITHPGWMSQREVMDWQTSFNAGPTNLSAKINAWFRENELDRLNDPGD
jgi:hypothetical protein